MHPSLQKIALKALLKKLSLQAEQITDVYNRDTIITQVTTTIVYRGPYDKQDNILSVTLEEIDSNCKQWINSLGAQVCAMKIMAQHELQNIADSHVE